MKGIQGKMVIIQQKLRLLDEKIQNTQPNNIILYVNNQSQSVHETVRKEYIQKQFCKNTCYYVSNNCHNSDLLQENN